MAVEVASEVVAEVEAAVAVGDDVAEAAPAPPADEASPATEGDEEEAAEKAVAKSKDSDAGAAVFDLFTSALAVGVVALSAATPETDEEASAAAAEEVTTEEKRPGLLKRLKKRLSN